MADPLLVDGDDRLPWRRAGGPPRGSATARDKRLLAAALIGLALGTGSVLADGLVPWRLVAILGNIIAPWVLAAFAAGRLARTTRAGGWLGAAALVVAVGAYYGGSAVRAAAEGSAPSGHVSPAVPLVWLVVALLVGPVMGAAGAASTRPRPALPAVLAPAVALLAEAVYLVLDRRPWRWHLAGELYRLADAGVLVAVVAVGVALPLRLVRDPGRRRLALACLAVGAAAGAVGIVLLYRLLRAIT